jgi:capsular exopolysaccharide synthesis family protein
MGGPAGSARRAPAGAAGGGGSGGQGSAARASELAGLAARQFRHVPGAPGGWARFLVAHLRWILVVTLVVVGAAAVLAHRQTPMYKSQASVDVWFASPDPTALQGPNMVTEKGIVSSGVVLAIASRSLGVPAADLQQGLSTNVPAGSSIMQIAYTDPVPWIARERAQVIAESYVAYRSPKTTVTAQGTKTPVQSLAALHATMITPASLPGSPASPNYLVDIVAALVVGLGLAIGSAALRDHLDDRFRGPADLEARTGAPVLALVPAFRSLPPDPASRLAMTWNPGSVVAEAYRGLRTEVLAAAAARDARTLLVTSPAWEEKSTVAANLAVALAQSGRHTLLVSADLRWGLAPELLGVGDESGLTSVLDWHTDLAAALIPPGVRNLRVLPAGPLPADPAEYLQRPALHALFTELRNNADFIVIDAPPVLAAPDAVPLMQFADMVLLVGDAR